MGEAPTIPLPETGGRASAAVPVDEYVRSFAWDEAKWPVKCPLRELTELLSGALGRMDDELKAKATEYGNAKGAKLGLERKEGGNLLVRSLDGLVKPSDFIDSEHLTTCDACPIVRFLPCCTVRALAVCTLWLPAR